MNKQEIFSTVATHLLQQKERSLHETKPGSKTCAYRGNGGMKCAVGILIKDEHYRPKLEGNTPYNEDVKDAVSKSIGRLLVEQDLKLLIQLQDVHDFRLTSGWEEALRSVANKNGLLFSLEQAEETPMNYHPFVYELGTTEEISEKWSFLEANATWRDGSLDGSYLLLYRNDYESVSDAEQSGGVYEIYCTSGSDLVSSLEAVRSTCFALGHYLCAAIKTRYPVSFEEPAEEKF